MPSREISNSENDLLNNWLWRKERLDEAKPIDHEINADRGAMVDSLTRSSLWMVDREPLTIAPRTHWFRDKAGRSVRGLIYFLYCSDHHANQLEEAGIIRFSEEPVQDAQTA